VKIIDDFLPHDKWQENYNLFMTEESKWTYKSIPQDPSSFFFQQVYNPKMKLSSYMTAIEPILEKIDYKEIITARTNLLPRMDSNYSFTKVDGAGLHNDHGFDFDYTTLIYYINTTNGGTCFYDNPYAHEEIVQSKANRLVIFNGHTLHRQIYQTDEKIRVATNINIIV